MGTSDDTIITNISMLFLRSVLFVLFLACIFSTFTHVHAQDNAGITLIPASIEKPANPGDQLSEVLRITNESDTEKEYFIYKKNIKGVEAGGVPIFAENEEEKTGYEITDWIDVPEKSIKVPANSSIDFPFDIRVPDTATPGSHFGGIFVSAEPPRLREIGAGVGYEVVSIISIRISGDVLDSARIRQFSTDKLLYSSKNVAFTAKIENQGNILIRPRGIVTITSMFGTKPETISVNESLAGVFPGTMRDFEFSWTGEGFGFGKYEAIIALVYEGENGQKTIDATHVFWIFPTKIILITLGIIVGIIVTGYIATRYYINRAIMRAAGGRRIVPQRYRRQTGISRFAFVFVSLMASIVVFLLIILIFFA